jgi:hypothetical protein
MTGCDNHDDTERLRVHAATSDATSSELFKDYDPQAIRAAIEQTAGSWSDVDVDAFIADLYAAREAGSRSMNRPVMPDIIDTSGEPTRLR